MLKKGDLVVFTIEGVFSGLAIIKITFNPVSKRQEWEKIQPNGTSKNYRDWLYENGYIDIPELHEVQL
jgi:hypothetical protein